MFGGYGLVDSPESAVEGAGGTYDGTSAPLSGYAGKLSKGLERADLSRSGHRVRMQEECHGFRTDGAEFAVSDRQGTPFFTGADLCAPVGQSGMLDGAEGDDYVEKLRYEYDYLRYKYALSPIGAHQWNWLRLRPQNFPSLRLAQFAQLLYETGDLQCERVLQAPFPQLRQWLSVVPDAYWETHYQLGKPTVEHASGVGASTADLLIINTIVPLRFCYARFFGDDAMQEDALALLERVGYEDNILTRVFKESGFPCRSAYDS